MASGHFFWAIFYFACLCSASLANNAKVNFREKEKKILDQILGAGKYDARIRPSGVNGTEYMQLRNNYFVYFIQRRVRARIVLLQYAL
uniref:Uncharacterized protein n=1 Tax=Anopheles epiroticus TaxID=199890 RepID=A0A182P2C8_9DIPT